MSYERVGCMCELLKMCMCVLYVVLSNVCVMMLFMSSTGAAPPPQWTTYEGKAWSFSDDDVCSYIEAKDGLPAQACQAACEGKVGCNAVNHNPGDDMCGLRTCPTTLTTPSLTRRGWNAYALTRPRPPLGK